MYVNVKVKVIFANAYHTCIWIRYGSHLQTTPYLPLPVGIHQTAPPRIQAQRTNEFNLLLIYRPQEDEWLSWPCWLTYSGRFTPRRSGHPSTARHGAGQGKFAGHGPTFQPLCYTTSMYVCMYIGYRYIAVGAHLLVGMQVLLQCCLGGPSSVYVPV